MTKLLGLKAGNEHIEIETNRSDYAAILIRGLVGAVPWLGPLTAELITTRIPNQKIDRIISVLKLLEDKINFLELDKAYIETRFTSEEFADLLEDALPQAARALSEERKEYIANLLKNSLTREDLDHAGKKKLLALLGELLDPEIILLHYYSLQGKGRERVFAFEDRYPFINKVIHEDTYRQPDVEEEILFSSYRGKLVMNSLIMGTGGITEHTSALGELLVKFVEPKP